MTAIRTTSRASPAMCSAGSSIHVRSDDIFAAAHRASGVTVTGISDPSEYERLPMPDGFQTFDPDRPPAFSSPRCTVLLRYWNRVRGDRVFPARADIDPAAIKEILPHILMLTVEYEPFRVRYRLVGTEIVRLAKFDFTGRYADALNFRDDSAEDWTLFYRASVDARQPGHGLAYYTVQAPFRRWSEFVIFPLSSDG